MKVDLSLNLKLDTADRRNEVLKAHYLAASGIQSLPKSHRRKGSRKRKLESASLIKNILQAVRWIPPKLIAAVFLALFGDVPKLLSK